jgi:L-cystine uptake protein TcyP (sodium:dicarboxylate symporter family)
VKLLDAKFDNIARSAFLAFLIGVPLGSLCFFLIRLRIERTTSLRFLALDTLGFSGYVVIFGMLVMLLFVVPLLYLLKKLHLNTLSSVVLIALIPFLVLWLLDLRLAPIFLLYSFLVAGSFSFFAFNKRRASS